MAARFLCWAVSAAVAAQAFSVGTVRTGPSRGGENSVSTQRQAYIAKAVESFSLDSTAEPLVSFQVATPVLSQNGDLTGGSKVLDASAHSDTPFYQTQLMKHDFAFSYTHPFVAKYEPPTSVNFSRVIVNLTVAVEGNQFDRLAILYLGDIEIWRTSTAEPTEHPGVVWSVYKDLTPYLSLWKQPQNLIFDLGNAVDDEYTGIFNTTLTATFIDDKIETAAAPPADLILPISEKRGSQGQSSVFTFPQDDTSVNVTLPQTINRAVVSISASAQYIDEFWWRDGPDVQDGEIGPGAFREARLRIDGQLAGVTWPFPVLFTGADSPGLHLPVVGPEVFDLREDEIDITPWLGLLSDGKEHKFSLEVAAYNESVADKYWQLTGKIFIWLSSDNSITTGPPPTVSADLPTYKTTQHGFSKTSFGYNQTVSRHYSASSVLKINGKAHKKTWSQAYNMSSSSEINNHTGSFNTYNLYFGESKALSDSKAYFYKGFNYPLTNLFAHNGETFDQGLDLTITGLTVFSNGLEPFVHKLDQRLSGSTTSSRKLSYNHFPSKGPMISHVSQEYKFGGRPLGDIDSFDFTPQPLLYSRDVKVTSSSVVSDKQYLYKSKTPK